MLTPDKRLTIDEISQQLGVDPDTPRAWIATGQLAAVNVCKSPGGRKPRWRVRQSDLDDFLAKRANRQPTAPQATARPRRAAKPPVREWF